MCIDPREEGNCSLTSRTINTTGHRRDPTGERHYSFLYDRTKNVAMFDILKHKRLMVYANLDTTNHTNQKFYFLPPN